MSTRQPKVSPSLAGELLHFSTKPLDRVESMGVEVQCRDAKPAGLWVSVGAAWAEWCVAESFALESLKFVTRVRLADDANILTLADAADLDAFTDQYGVPDRTLAVARTLCHDVDWMLVAADFDGIIIAPYCHERRHSLMWYYGWDVASGCIWNARAIAALESSEIAQAVA